MLLKTILNTVEKHKSFVYSDARWSKQKPGREIEFDVQPRKNAKPICSGCGRKRPGYDCQVGRRFEFVPLWAIPVFLVYAMRRVNCPQCGVVVEWGIAHQDLTNITSIGIDEIQYRRGHKYLTLVYPLDEGAKRLLYVARDRTGASLNGFFNVLSEPTINGIQFACTDMLPAYLKVLKARASQALNILDRFHIMKKFGEDTVETRIPAAQLVRISGPVFRYCGGLQQQSQIDHEKSLCLQDV